MDPELQAWIANMKAKQENKREGKSCELSDAMEYSLFRLGISLSLSQEVQAKINDGSIHQERISLFVDNGGFKTWEKWRFMFDELAAFKDSQGNFIVLQRKNPTLYSWVYRVKERSTEKQGCFKKNLICCTVLGLPGTSKDLGVKSHSYYSNKLRLSSSSDHHLYLTEKNNGYDL